MVLCRWWYDVKTPEGRALIKAALPGVSMLVVPGMSKGLYKKAHAQGMGRHTREEVIKLGEEDVRAISHFLGTDQWLSVRLQYLHCVSNGDTAVLH